MRTPKAWPDAASSESKKISAMRRATSGASNRFSIGGVEKKGHFAPKPITLPKTPWDDEKEKR